MKKKKEWVTLVVRYVIAIVVGMVFIWVVSPVLPNFLADMFLGEKSARPFTFQIPMWVVFFLGVGVLYDRHRGLRESRGYSKKHYLPTDEALIFDSRDLANILRSVKADEHGEMAYSPRLIKLIILKYQASKSVEQASSMLNSLQEVFFQEISLRYSFIRYLVWLIPTLGFMGTVYGISLAVGVVGTSSPDDPNLLGNIAINLGTAFNTTLVALVQSAALVFVIHLLESTEEGQLNRLGTYVLEHLINKLE